MYAHEKYTDYKGETYYDCRYKVSKSLHKAILKLKSSYLKDNIKIDLTKVKIEEVD
jgi:hypothetical protein